MPLLPSVLYPFLLFLPWIPGMVPSPPHLPLHRCTFPSLPVVVNHVVNAMGKLSSAPFPHQVSLPSSLRYSDILTTSDSHLSPIPIPIPSPSSHPPRRRLCLPPNHQITKPHYLIQLTRLIIITARAPRQRMLARSIRNSSLLSIVFQPSSQHVFSVVNTSHRLVLLSSVRISSLVHNRQVGKPRLLRPPHSPHLTPHPSSWPLASLLTTPLPFLSCSWIECTTNRTHCQNNHSFRPRRPIAFPHYSIWIVALADSRTAFSTCMTFRNITPSVFYDHRPTTVLGRLLDQTSGGRSGVVRKV